MTDVELNKIIAGVVDALQPTPVTPVPSDTLTRQEVEVLLLKNQIELLKQQAEAKPVATTTNPDNGLDINKLLSYKMLSGIF